MHRPPPSPASLRAQLPHHATGVPPRAAIGPKYVVQQGDSLFSIQQKFNLVSPGELAALVQPCLAAAVWWPSAR